MANIGSVFLGDVQRLRVFSTSTPPSSPPASANPYSGILSASLQATGEDEIEDEGGRTAATTAPSGININTTPRRAVTIDPILALELRLRWVEALVLGVPDGAPTSVGARAPSHRKARSIPLKSTRSTSGADTKAALLKRGETLARLAKDLRTRLDAIVEANEELKRFIAQYDQHAHLLTPAATLSGILADTRLGVSSTAPDYSSMPFEEFEALLQEMEPDIRAADRDMREIEMLESKGVTGAGKLAVYEELKPRLEALIKAYQEDLELVGSLEKRVAELMRNNATQVDALSELFVAWDDTLTEAENKVTRLEREKAERLRLGLELDTY